MIHQVNVTNHTTVSAASFLARTPEGKQVMFIIEGPRVEGVAPSHHDRDIMTAIFKAYKTLESDCRFLWVQPGYIVEPATITTYDPQSSVWAADTFEYKLSDLSVDGGLDVNVTINNYENELLRAARNLGRNG